MTNYIEKLILKEFDRHTYFNSYDISNFMKNLDSDAKKNKFLSFMIDSRGLILTYNDVFNQLKLLENM